MTSIEQNRACTDIPMLLAFVAFCGFIGAYTWSQAFTDGSPNR